MSGCEFPLHISAAMHNGKRPLKCFDGCQTLNRAKRQKEKETKTIGEREIKKKERKARSQGNRKGGATELKREAPQENLQETKAEGSGLTSAGSLVTP